MVITSKDQDDISRKFIVDGYTISATFLAKPNSQISHQVKQVLLSSLTICTPDIVDLFCKEI